MGALQPPPLPYTKQVNHKRPMTYAFTDTVQIEELGAGWELPLDLNAALEAVDAALDAAYPYLLPPDMVSDGETEWATAWLRSISIHVRPRLHARSGGFPNTEVSSNVRSHVRFIAPTPQACAGYRPKASHRARRRALDARHHRGQLRLPRRRHLR